MLTDWAPPALKQALEREGTGSPTAPLGAEGKNIVKFPPNTPKKSSLTRAGPWQLSQALIKAKREQFPETNSHAPGTGELVQALYGPPIQIKKSLKTNVYT